MKTIPFNLNNNVFVKITDKGIDKLVKQTNTDLRKFGNSTFTIDRTHYDKYKNEDGFYRVHLHELMDMYSIIPNEIEYNILLEIK